MADRFGIDRLKRLCELEMLSAISTESAAHILYTADLYNAEVSLLYSYDCTYVRTYLTALLKYASRSFE